jgi:serine/threonine-protein kinase
VLGAAAFVILGGLVVVIATTRERKQDAPSPAISALAAMPAPRKSFVLVIDSTPSGAEVREGDRVLGTTPMQLTIDNDAVRAEPRKLTVQRDGFQRYSILQGASDDNVRIIASLVPQPVEAVPASAKAAGPGAPAAHVAKPPKAVPAPEHTPPPAAPPPPPAPPSPPPGDIRLQR